VHQLRRRRGCGTGLLAAGRGPTRTSEHREPQRDDDGTQRKDEHREREPAGDPAEHPVAVDGAWPAGPVMSGRLALFVTRGGSPPGEGSGER
jgi:hypothetical protein